jgi:iron complex outermembrane receptor protein
MPANKYNRLFTLTALAAAVAAPVQLMAQTSQGVLEEVIVTAQKRAQSAQDIGMSVTAFSGDAMRTQRITQAVDLARTVPNVSSLNVSGGGVPILIVRGIGLQNFRINDSPTTAVYVDEVYQTSVATADFSMFDLERLELLKGPQGGLYGRNTISGALQVISERPDIGDEPNGYMHLEYGDYQRTQVEGGYTLPLGDSAAMRLSGRWEQSDDAEWENILTNEEHGEIDRWAGRGLFRFAPSDDIDLLLKIHGGNDESELPLMRALPVLEDLGTAADAGVPIPNAENVGLANFAPNTCSSILAAQGVKPQCANNTSITNQEYGLGSGDGDRFDSVANRAGYLDNSWGGASFNASFTFGDYVLTSISAYDSLDYRRVSDLDALPITWAEADYQTDIDAWSQEFRLAFEGDGNVNWVAGINYAEDDLEEDTFFDGSEGAFPAVLSGALSVRQDYEQHTDSFAAYGHLEWGFSESWNLIAEARYSDVEKTFEAQEYLGFTGGSEAPFIAGKDDTSFDNLSGKLALEWDVTDEAMLYGSISSGFKTGGFNGGVVFSSESLKPYDEETVLAYELGAKSDWMDGRVRLNGAIFYYDREDVQQTATDISGDVSVTRLTNVGDVEVYGAEMDMTWLATEGLTLQLSLGWTDSELDDSDLFSSTVPGVPQSPIEGTNTPNYSKYSGNFLGRYEHSVTDNLLGFAQVEYSYRSDRDLNLVTSKVEEAVLEEDGYGLTNIRLGLGPESGQWHAIVFVENVTDESYRILLRDNGLRGMHTLYGEPRIWGVSFTYHFGS